MTRNERGMTLIEIFAVLGLVAVLAWALYPMVKTTYDSWVVADRRTEIIEEGRVGMTKMIQEVRRAYDLYSATDSTYIDFYPWFATGTQYRFAYSAATHEVDYSATPTFTADSLAAPIDSFLYKTYTRRLTSNTTRARQVNAIYFLFGVSDSRQKLTAPLVPMKFRSFVQIRNSREGYTLAKSMAFATESFVYRYTPQNQFCVKAFCDRTDPQGVTTALVTMNWGVANSATMALAYFATDDYYATCCTTSNVATKCYRATDPNARVTIQISDATETCQIRETVRIRAL